MTHAAELDGDGIVLRVIVGSPEYAAATLGGTWVSATEGQAAPGHLLYDGSFFWPWVGSTHAEDTYDLGAWRYHPGLLLVFENITPDNAHEPGVSGWRNRTGEWPQWFQPAGAHDAYQIGAKVSDEGFRWTNNTPNNVWKPGVFGWTNEGAI